MDAKNKQAFSARFSRGKVDQVRITGVTLNLDRDQVINLANTLENLQSDACLDDNLIDLADKLLETEQSERYEHNYEEESE